MFRDNQFFNHDRRQQELNQNERAKSRPRFGGDLFGNASPNNIQNPRLLSYLSPSQTLNGMRGRWLGNNTSRRRAPVTEERQGRGGRPPVFTPEARPIQERASEAAQRHRVPYEKRQAAQESGDQPFRRAHVFSRGG